MWCNNNKRYNMKEQFKAERRIQRIEARKQKVRNLIVEGTAEDNPQKIKEALLLNTDISLLSDRELLILAGDPFKLICYNAIQKVGREHLTCIQLGGYEGAKKQLEQPLMEYLLLNKAERFNLQFSERANVKSIYYNSQKVDIELQTMSYYLSNRDNETIWKTKDVYYILNELQRVLNVFDAYLWFENEVSPYEPF